MFVKAAGMLRELGQNFLKKILRTSQILAGAANRL